MRRANEHHHLIIIITSIITRSHCGARLRKDTYSREHAMRSRRDPCSRRWSEESCAPAASAHPQPSSAAQPACAAPRRSEESRGQKFLAALEEAAYEREDNPAQATVLRELVNSLWWGKLLRVPTDDVWHLDAEKQEDFAQFPI